MNDTTVELLETIDRIERIQGIVAILPQEAKDRSRIDDYMVVLLNAAKALTQSFLVDNDPKKADLARDLALMALAHIKENGLVDDDD